MWEQREESLQEVDTEGTLFCVAERIILQYLLFYLYFFSCVYGCNAAPEAQREGDPVVGNNHRMG